MKLDDNPDSSWTDDEIIAKHRYLGFSFQPITYIPFISFTEINCLEVNSITNKNTRISYP
jgi:hypothetical protein